MIWLHGNPGSNRSPKIPRLRKRLLRLGVTVHNPDLNTAAGTRYTVDSAVRAIEQLVTANKLDEVVLVGHSFGGRVAAKLGKSAVLAPKLRAMVLIAPALEGKHPTLPGGVPVKIFHGDGDAVVPLARSRDLVERHRRASERARRAPSIELVTLRDDHVIRGKRNEKRLLDQTAAFFGEAFGLTTQQTTRPGPTPTLASGDLQHIGDGLR